ncbi:YciI family protein [Ciceribacter sp. L1K23]|uniref:YciI family protein n=1 Tax=unclassified Ciceribacter TaxID=2628820 RepID=UPI001ABE29FE|nr:MULTISPECIES: YciI family protein [unclassified Ciceribacter]MBO3759184.1 YciI family protein [Ciceribacter sp. L1K22]MBR0556669.1 YciI family protein [Ciceribacter sp. L1K23]
MKYMLLLYAAPGTDPVPGTPECDDMMAEFFSLDERMKDRATVLAGEGLLPATTATTLRTRDGKVEMLDGPFAETREHLGGFYLIEAATLDDALAFAAAVPVARYGSVEVRPVEIFS